MSLSVDTQEEILKKLRSDAMRGKWTEVFETYKQKRKLREAKITGTGDTMLHMAVSSGEKEVAKKMIDLLVREQNDPAQNNVVVTLYGDCQETWNMNVILGIENDRKDTPLHFAARMGNVKMCTKIGGIDHTLIARRNIAGETPLFLAALYGEKEAFLWLHYLYRESTGVSSTDFAHCIRDNGDTILHCTIAQGHIDVAIEIVHLYKDHMRKMMERNKEGLSPLHLLAAQRSAFKSTWLLELPRIVHPIYRFLKGHKKNQATTLEELRKRLLKVEEKNQATKLEELLKELQKELPEKNQEIVLVFIYSCSLLLLAPLLPLGILLSLLFFVPVSRLLLLGRRLRKMKEKHTWTLQIMNELLQQASKEDMSQIISTTAPEHFSVSLQTEEDNGGRWIETQSGTITIETPLMIATKNGVTEMVEKILELFPSTIKDLNAEDKNIVLLAVEYRQTDVFRILCKQNRLSESLFRQVDKEGNNALHLAARLGVEPDWLNPGEALSMTREIKWFEFVNESMPYGLLERYNKKMETPDDIFREDHKQLMKGEGEWVAKASQACSVVSTLVLSVAYATRNSVPGGYDANNGYAILRNKQPVFKIFEVSSFMAILFSLISTIRFLSIVASPSQSVHSWRYVPYSLYGGMIFMFVSIVCLWISFNAADFFTLDDDSQKLNYTLPCYILSSWIIIYIVVDHLPTFFGPTWSAIVQIPVAKRKATRPIEYQRTKNKENGTDLNRQN